MNRKMTRKEIEEFGQRAQRCFYFVGVIVYSSTAPLRSRRLVLVRRFARTSGR